MGEAGAWPRIGAGSGLIDRNGLIKPSGYQRASWWRQTPMVYIDRGGYGGRANGRRANGGRGDSGNVEVYSNCPSVELFLDGKSLGSKTKPADDSPRSWAVAETGRLKAVGSNGGKPAAVFELRPAGPAAKLSLSTDTHGWVVDSLNPAVREPLTALARYLPHDYDDVATVQITITDADGNRVVSARTLVTFKLTGPAKIAAVDNGAADNHESFQGSQVHAFAGQCCVSIRSTADSGAITLTADAPGLAEGTLTFKAQPPGFFEMMDNLQVP
jgi:beta-galactosidase